MGIKRSRLELLGHVRFLCSMSPPCVTLETLKPNKQTLELPRHLAIQIGVWHGTQGETEKTHTPGTRNNHLKVDVWWNNNFYVKNWNHPIEKNSWAEIQTLVPFFWEQQKWISSSIPWESLGKSLLWLLWIRIYNKITAGGWFGVDLLPLFISYNVRVKKTEILYNQPPCRVFFCNHVYDPSVVGWLVCLLLGILSPGKDATWSLFSTWGWAITLYSIFSITRGVIDGNNIHSLLSAFNLQTCNL